MKKVYLIIVLIFTLFISSCSLLENISQIELVNLANGEKTIIKGDSEDSKIITKAIKSKEKTDDSISDLISYEILLKKNSQTDYYKLSFNMAYLQVQ